MVRIQRHRRGHTLMEALFAAMLVVVCALIFAATMPTANNSRAKADLNNIATSLAQKQAEAIKAQGYANATPTQLLTLGLIDSTTPTSTDTYAFTNSDNAALDNPARVLPQGRGFVTVTQVDTDLRRIIILVQWSDRGQTRSMQLGTLIANL